MLYFCSTELAVHLRESQDILLPEVEHFSPIQGNMRAVPKSPILCHEGADLINTLPIPLEQ